MAYQQKATQNSDEWRERERENLSWEHAESSQHFSAANILSTVTREPIDIKKRQH